MKQRDDQDVSEWQNRAYREPEPAAMKIPLSGGATYNASMSKTLNLEEFLKAPRIDCLDDPGCTMSDIFREIKRKTGASYEELGKLADISVSGAARLVRGDTTVYLQDPNLATFIKKVRLPFKRALYINAASKFAANVPATEMMEHGLFEEGEGGGRPLVYSYIRVAPSNYASIVSLDELRAFLAKSDTPTETLPRDCAVPRELEDRILVRQQSRNMISATEIKYIIQPGAIVEVQWVDNLANILTGDVVMAQIGEDEMARAYVYERRSSPEGVFELFRSTNAAFAVKVCRATRAVGGIEGLAKQRLILGRVNRVVDYSFI